MSEFKVEYRNGQWNVTYDGINLEDVVRDLRITVEYDYTGRPATPIVHLMFSPAALTVDMDGASVYRSLPEGVDDPIICANNWTEEG